VVVFWVAVLWMTVLWVAVLLSTDRTQKRLPSTGQVNWKGRGRLLSYFTSEGTSSLGTDD
jgi:hypothetical protein